MARSKTYSILRRLALTNQFCRDNGIILKELENFQWTAISALSFTIFSAFLEGITVGLIASFLQILTNPNEPPVQSGIQWLDVWVLATEAPTAERLYRVAALILVIIWIRSGLLYLGNRYMKLCQILLAEQIRKRIFDQLQNVSLGFYSKTNSGHLINSMTNQVNQLMQSFGAVSFLITKGSTLLAYVISMFWLSWQLSIMAIAMFALMSAGVSNLIRRVREASFAIPVADGKMTSATVEFINGIRTIHAFTTQDFERRKFYRAADEVVDSHRRVLSLSEMVQPLVEGAASTVLIVIVAISFSIFVVNGELRAASILTFMFVLFRLRPLVAQTSKSRSNLGTLQGAFDNIKELLRTDNKPYLKDGFLSFSGLKNSIEFVSVDFGYNSRELILHDISLTIDSGKTTALVGSSGAGKTTLANLIPRFYDPTRGKVLVDGTDLKEFQVNSLRQKMAVVSQDTFIFNTSVRDNIAYGLDEVSDKDIHEVARLANALDFILEMPEGFDTPLGDRGVRLSGGQRQRIAIARALLRNPEILILDEATSALDSVTESLIQESLEGLSKGRTVIAIAHRLSTIIKADKVIVLEQGRVIEQGRYKELLNQRGALWKYHQMQYAAEKTAI